LVSAVIQVESNGRSDAVSEKGCIGLMGINPKGALAEWIECETPHTYNGFPIPYKCSCRIATYTQDLYNKKFNIEVGTFYLHRLHEFYGCKTVEQITSAYHGGIGRLRSVHYDVTKMSNETKRYVFKVLSIYNKRTL